MDGSKKKGNRVALHARAVRHAMWSGDHPTARPAMQDITNIHHERSWKRWNIRPGALGRADTQATDIVLREQGDRPEIRMRGTAEFVLGSLGVLRRVRSSRSQVVGSSNQRVIESAVPSA